jgi:hypothetical protein
MSVAGAPPLRRDSDGLGRDGFREIRMSQQIEKLKWFLENLDLQIEDLERQEHDKAEIELYFDSADIHDAVLGLQAFFQDGGDFDERLFRSPKTLVNCLATSGWLRMIRMLPSHQAEFLSLMNHNFWLGTEEAYRRDYPRKKNLFLNFVKANIGDRSVGRLGEDIPEGELIAFVEQIKQQAKSAELLFKAYEAIGLWHHRLAKLMREESLYLEKDKFKYAEIVSTDTFQDLKAAFDKRRKSDNTMNNFADALAVAILIERVKLYPDTKKLPRYYVSTDLFRDAIEMAGVAPQLIYREHGKSDALMKASSFLTEPRGVLRGADYFIFKAAFGSRQRTDKPGEQLKPFGDMNLYELRGAVVKILDAREPLSDAAVESIKVAGRSLNDIIQEVRQFSFLNNVWLQFIEEADITKLKNLEEDALDLVRQNEVSKAIQATKEALASNVKGYREVKFIWQDLKNASSELQARARHRASEPSEIFRDLGLLRFAFPNEARDLIERVLDAIMRGEENQQRGARNAVITAYYSGNEDEELVNLILVSAVLWVAGMNKRLIKRLEETIEVRGALPHYSLKMVLAAAIFRSGGNQRGDLRRCREILSDLANEFTRARDPKRKVDLAVGLAYLHFHNWWSLGYRPFWYPPPVEITKRSSGSEDMRLVLRAIEYSKQAYDLLRRDDMTRKVYALNQYLYYLVMGGDESREEEMDNAAMSLAAYKANREWWQYRCDDTLARYFHRKAVTAKTEDKWKELMVAAREHIKKAQQESHGDEQVESYFSIFSVDSLKWRHVLSQAA